MADAEEQRRATARGEAIRGELLAALQVQGSATAADLLPAVKAADVSLSEIAFQLDRLTEEGQTVGEQGEPYHIA